MHVARSGSPQLSSPLRVKIIQILQYPPMHHNWLSFYFILNHAFNRNPPKQAFLLLWVVYDSTWYKNTNIYKIINFIDSVEHIYSDIIITNNLFQKNFNTTVMPLITAMNYNSWIYLLWY